MRSKARPAGRPIISGVLAVLALALAACEREPYDYPQSAETAFHRSCPAEDAVCACTWDRITRALAPEEYEEALARFKREGIMDHRIAAARTECLAAK